jgi:hypothetical protein
MYGMQPQYFMEVSIFFRGYDRMECAEFSLSVAADTVRFLAGVKLPVFADIQSHEDNRSNFRIYIPSISIPRGIQACV